MRSLLPKRLLLRGALASSRSAPAAATAGEIPLRPAFSSTREDHEVSYGLNWALTGRGVLVKDKAFYNLKPSELQKHGAKSVECLSGLPIHVRGNAVGGASEVSKAQFANLLKQVTTHISSVCNVFVQDGAITSSSKCDAKVRVISDSPSAALSLSNILWKTTSRAVSHDSSPLTVYVATSVSPGTGEILGLGSQASNGFLAVDIERLSLIICGKAFADTKGVKNSLAALAAPVISARGGLPLSARPLAFGDSLTLLFSSEDTIKSCTDLHENIISADGGVVLSSHGVASFFQIGDLETPTLLKKPASLIIASADSTGALPPIVKLSPGQAAYHFLAGYQDGKFVPTFSGSPSPITPLELAKALLLHLKDSGIPSFLVNVMDRGKRISGSNLVNLVKSTLPGNVPHSSLVVASDPKESRGSLSSAFGRAHCTVPRGSRSFHFADALENNVDLWTSSVKNGLVPQPFKIRKRWGKRWFMSCGAVKLAG